MAKELKLYDNHHPNYRGLCVSEVPQTPEILRVRARLFIPTGTIVERAGWYVQHIKSAFELYQDGPVKQFRSLIAGMDQAYDQLKIAEATEQQRRERLQLEGQRKWAKLEREAERTRNQPLWSDLEYGPVWPSESLSLEESCLLLLH